MATTKKKSNKKGKFDFTSFAKTDSLEEKTRQLESHYTNADYIVLSDPMMHLDENGREVIRHIEERIKLGRVDPATGKPQQHLPYTWKLKVLKNTDGSKPKPGQRIEWKRQLKNKWMGKKVGTTQVREAQRRGDGDRFLETGAAILDENCCLDLGYQDASQLLSNNGIYFRSGYPISMLPEFFRNGAYHNWRFIEVPPWEEPSDETPLLVTVKDENTKGKKGSLL